MFSYEINNDRILVTLPKVIKFNKIFHEAICKLLYVIGNNKISKKLIVHAKNVVLCDNMCKAMLCNVMSHISENHIKEVYIDREFRDKISSQVRSENIETYSHKDILDLIISPNIEYYAMKEDDNPGAYIEDLVQKIVSNSLCFSINQVKDLLVSTIGEIIANCRNHSKQDMAYIMYHINWDKENKSVYLQVNVIDYGETIVETVRNYFNRPRMPIKTCIEWARECGHSTKNGSGGYGIPQIIDYLKAANGRLYIYSGSGVLLLDDNGVETIKRLENGDFKGTSVSFSVKLFETDKMLVVEENEFKSIKSVSLKDLISER